MSKNLTRKVMALGAVVALGASVFAGSPAQALTGNVTLVPSAGTNYNVLLTDAFVLKTDLAVSAGDASKLKYKITNAAASTLTLLTSPDAGTTYKGAQDNGSATAITDSATPFSLASTSVSTSFVAVPRDTSVNTASQYLKIGTTTTTADTTITVQAWVDQNNNGTIDTDTEFATDVRTVKFVKASNVTATATVTKPALNDTTIKAAIALSGDINLEQLTAASDVDVLFYKDGVNTFGAGATAVKEDNLLWDAVNSKYEASETIPAATAATYSAQVQIAGVNSGSASIGTVAATVAKSVTVATVSNTNLQAKTVEATNIVGAAALGTAANAKIRKATTAFDVVITVKDNATTAAAVVGESVTVNVSDTGLTSTEGVTLNGSAYDGTSKAVTGVTNAAGQFTISVVAATTEATDALVFDTRVQSANVADLTVEWAAAAFDLVNLAGDTGASADVDRTIAVGGSVALAYAVVDQWGIAPTDAYQVTITRAVAAARTTAATFGYQAAVAAGKANITVVDNGAGAGSDTISAKLYPVLAGGALGTAVGTTRTFVLTYSSVAADITPTAVSATVNNDGVGTTSALVKPVAIEALALASLDTRVEKNVTVPAYATYNAYADAAAATAATIAAKVSGNVTSVTGAGIVGVPVTISAAGLLFKYASNTGAVYAKNSITVISGAAGAYEVAIIGQTSGKQTITVTSGAATKTASITFATASVSAVALSAPTLTQAGRAVDAVATVTDKFGNVVAGAYVKFTATGVGAINGSSSAVVATDATGKASVKLVIGAGETGDAVVTATSVTDSTGATATTDIAVKATTVTAGVTDAQIDIVGKRVTSVTSFSKGKTVSFYVDGIKKWSKVSTSDADVVLFYNLKKGTHTVTVKISGGFVTTEKFIVK